MAFLCFILGGRPSLLHSMHSAAARLSSDSCCQVSLYVRLTEAIRPRFRPCISQSVHLLVWRWMIMRPLVSLPSAVSRMVAFGRCFPRRRVGSVDRIPRPWGCWSSAASQHRAAATKALDPAALGPRLGQWQRSPERTWRASGPQVDPPHPPCCHILRQSHQEEIQGNLLDPGEFESLYRVNSCPL